MRHPHYLITLLLPVLLLAGCTGSKSMAKKGSKLDEAGLYAEAAEMYYQSLQRNRNNVDAKIGMKKTGQQVLNEKLSSFFRAVSVGGDKGAAVDAFLDAADYAEKVQRMGVMLEIPDHYRTEFAQVKGEFLVELYERGQGMLEKQDYAGAEKVFARIAKLEPGYKDATSLQTLAYVEPLYRSGKEALQQGHYRKAYNDLGRVLEKDRGYKDASSLRQEALTKGRYAIAVLPFSSPSGRKDQAARVQAYATSALTELGDPFVQVVDRENMDRILEEQRLGLSGVVDEQTAVRVGNLMGAQAVLMGTVLDYREEPGTQRRSTRDGYEAYQARELNKETNEYVMVTRYKPVKYLEYLQENKVVVSVNYKLVSLETGQVLYSKVIDRERKDQVYYASYEGTADRLLPMRNGQPDASDRARRELQALLRAPREMKPMTTLSNDLLRATCSDMVQGMAQELSSIVP
ncbi:MAG: hypothetical protein JNM31_05000 [Flavobacteriales bacterium]|nr:hypothetical protein [Flavobacteriales bacterium]